MMLGACTRTVVSQTDDEGNPVAYKKQEWNPLSEEWEDIPGTDVGGPPIEPDLDDPNCCGNDPGRGTGDKGGGGSDGGGGGQGSSGGSGGSPSQSDIRLKQDIVLLKKLANGLNLYRFRY